MGLYHYNQIHLLISPRCSCSFSWAPRQSKASGRPASGNNFPVVQTILLTGCDSSLHIPTASPKSKNCIHSEFKFTLNTSDLYQCLYLFFTCEKTFNKCHRPSAQPGSIKGVSNFNLGPNEQVETSPMKIQGFHTQKT